MTPSEVKAIFLIAEIQARSFELRNVDAKHVAAQVRKWRQQAARDRGLRETDSSPKRRKRGMRPE